MVRAAGRSVLVAVVATVTVGVRVPGVLPASVLTPVILTAAVLALGALAGETLLPDDAACRALEDVLHRVPGLGRQRTAEARRQGPAGLREPLDDLPGQTDEANLGLAYAELDAYLQGHDVPVEVAEAIEARYRATEHKRQVPATPFDEWWHATA